MGSIGKAIGAMKDQTSISLAKVTGTVAPDLEVLVVKATAHDDEPADEKYLREILSLMASSRTYVTAFVSAVSKRLSRTRNWKVAIKALILVHQLTIDPNPPLCEEIVNSARLGTRVLSMAEFRVEANSNHWDHAGFIRVYALYLEEKMQLEVLERDDRIRENKYEDDRFYRREPVDDYYTRSRTEKQGESLPSPRQKRTPLTEMTTGMVLRRFKQLWTIIRRVLACRPSGSATNSRLILLAFTEVVKESFVLYVEICEALSVIFDRFTKDENDKSQEGFDAYVSAAKMMDELVEFYSWCKDMGIARSSMYPQVQTITDHLLETLKGFLKKTGNGSSSPERSQPEKEEDPVRDIHEVPPQTDAPRSSSPSEAARDPETPPVQKQLVVVDLMDFTDYDVPVEGGGNAMTLWETSPKEWQTQAGEMGNADWELALVETAKNLSEQKSEMGIDLDTLILNGMNDQGTVNSHLSSAPLQYGSSLTLPEPEKKTIPVVANDPIDPFAASLAVPPPLYLQAAEVEKKQQMLMQGNQLWQQYGMQGQVGSPRTIGTIPQPMGPQGNHMGTQGNHMGPPSGYYYTPPY